MLLDNTKKRLCPKNWSFFGSLQLPPKLLPIDFNFFFPTLLTNQASPPPSFFHSPCCVLIMLLITVYFIPQPTAYPQNWHSYTYGSPLWAAGKQAVKRGKLISQTFGHFSAH